MKKSTLFVVIVALLLGGVVYYREVRHRSQPEPAEPPPKPLFSFDASDITSMRIKRGDQTTLLEKRAGAWAITQPLETQADQSVVGGIASSLASAQVSARLSAAPDRMASYGLSSPAVIVEFQQKNGAKHRVQLGTKDFSGIQAYALADDSKDVLLLPASLLSVTDKSLDEMRDRSVLDLTVADVTGFDLKNSMGEIVVTKQPGGWQIEKPHVAPAAEGAAIPVLAQVAAGKMASIVSETPTDLGKYGLQKPVLSLEVRLAGGAARTLLIGKKVEDEYYARDSARPMIFRVQAELFKKLNVGFSDLRDKSLVHFEFSNLSRVEVRSLAETVVCLSSADGKWILDQPASEKGKEVNPWKFLGPLDNAQAKEILDAPSATISDQLKKPAVRVTLTDKSGKATNVSISPESGGLIYARNDASGPAIYKLDKKLLDDLSFKVSDILLGTK